jgi:hypothetical protein
LYCTSGSALGAAITATDISTISIRTTSTIYTIITTHTIWDSDTTIIHAHALEGSSRKIDSVSLLGIRHLAPSLSERSGCTLHCFSRIAFVFTPVDLGARGRHRPFYLLRFFYDPAFIRRTLFTLVSIASFLTCIFSSGLLRPGVLCIAYVASFRRVSWSHLGGSFASTSAVHPSD